jgi:hypothetical protein
MPKGADGSAIGKDADSANIRRVDAASESSMECPADIGRLSTSAALDRALDRRELALKHRATAAAAVACVGGGGAVAGVALNKAANDAATPTLPPPPSPSQDMVSAFKNLAAKIDGHYDFLTVLPKIGPKSSAWPILEPDEAARIIMQTQNLYKIYALTWNFFMQTQRIIMKMQNLYKFMPLT